MTPSGIFYRAVTYGDGFLAENGRFAMMSSLAHLLLQYQPCE